MLSYNRMTERLRDSLFVLTAYLKSCQLGTCTGISFIDSTPLSVCHNRRVHIHKTFASLAQREKTAMGWFYGFKLHIIINHLGQVIRFQVSKGNLDDRKPLEKERSTRGVWGQLVGIKVT